MSIAELILRIENEKIKFDVFKALKYLVELDTWFQVDRVEKMVADTFAGQHPLGPLEACCSCKIPQAYKIVYK